MVQGLKFQQYLLQVQETNRELGKKLKEKDAQLSRLRDVNRELRKVNKISKMPTEANDDVDELKTQLVERERQLDVSCK